MVWGFMFFIWMQHHLHPVVVAQQDQSKCEAVAKSLLKEQVLLTAPECQKFRIGQLEREVRLITGQEPISYERKEAQK